MQEIALCTSIFLSGIVSGLMILLYHFVKGARKELDSSVREYNDILKKVSEANLSMSNKLLDIEQKISTLEFWKQTSTAVSQTSAFKVK